MKKVIKAVLTATGLVGLATAAFAFTSEDIQGFSDKTVLTRLSGEDNGYAYVDKRSIRRDGGVPSANIFRFLAKPVDSFDAALLRVYADCETGQTKLGPKPLIREAMTGKLKEVQGDPDKMVWEDAPTGSFRDSAHKYLCSDSRTQKKSAGVVFADNSRFVFSDQTVKDKRTGLIWTRDANLGKRGWNGAPERVKELNRQKYAGYKDWRLPSKEELETLVTYAKSVGYDGILDSDHPYLLFNKMGFYDVQANSYWTSSLYATNIYYVWFASMNDGSMNYEDKIVGSNYNVWPVRAGK